MLRSSKNESTSLLQFEEFTSPEPRNEEKGLGFTTSVCYLIGLFGIMPIIALPGAVVHAGWAGFVIVIAMFIIESYTAILLAKCWLLLELFWPQFAEFNQRNPYPALAEKVGGLKFRKVVNILLNISICSASIPFLLIAAEMVQKILEKSSNGYIYISFCYWLVVMSFIMLPIVFLGTPKDLNIVTWLGATTVVATVIICHVKLAFDSETITKKAPPLPTWNAAAYCFGAVAFQIDTHSTILTVQIDMKDKNKTPAVVVVAYAGAFMLFMSIVIVAYIFYGSDITSDILVLFNDSALLYVLMGIVAVQSLMCLVMGLNTFFQVLEEKFNIPDRFGWKRVLIRTIVMMIILFLSSSLPHFSVAMELVGGLFATQFAFIFPPIFYVVLKHRACGVVNLKEVFLGFFIIGIGVLGSISATIESMQQMSDWSAFAPPCYVNITAASIYAVNTPEDQVQDN